MASAMQSAADIPITIKSTNSTSERRINPSWTISHFKTRLEPITGIPARSQRLSLHHGARQVCLISPPAGGDSHDDDDTTTLASFPLQAHAEIIVHDTRPPSHRTDYTDLGTVPKYTMPAATYATLPSTVLAWKKAQQLGRFNPAAATLTAQKTQSIADAIAARGIRVGRRCRIAPVGSDGRRGRVAYVGAVAQLPGPAGGAWVGVALDEPVGRNDGSVDGVRYFGAGERCGVFVRPERVEVGDFPPLDDVGTGLDGEMEEM